MTDIVLGIRLTADGKGLVGEVRLSREEVEKLTKATKEAGDTSRTAADDGQRYASSLEGIAAGARLAGYAITAVAGALALKAKSVFEASTELARFSEQTGRSVEWLQRMKFVADQSDVSFDNLLHIYQRLPRAIVEAFGENSPSGRALRALGIDPRQLRDTDQAMLLIADRFRQVQDPMVQAAIAEMIFKRRGEELIPILNKGAEGIRELYERGGQYAHITAENARAAQELKQQWRELENSGGELTRMIANDLVPWLNRVVSELRAASEAAGGIGGGIALWARSFIGDPGAKLSENVRKLEELKRLRSELSQDTFANRANEAIWGDVASLDRQIAFFEKQNQVLRLAQQQRALASGGTEPDVLTRRATTDYAAVAAAVKRGQPTLKSLDKTSTESSAGESLIRGLEDQLASLDPRATLVDKIIRHLTETTNVYTEAEKATALAIAGEIDMRKAEKEALDAYVQSLRGAAQVEDEVYALRLKSQDQLNAVVNENKTELDRLEDHLKEKQKIIETAVIYGQINREQADRQLELLQLQHQARLGNAAAQGALARRNFDQQTWKQQTQTVLSELLAMTQGVAAHNRVMFEINKAAGIANAIINTYEGVTQALKHYPPPLSFAMAAAQLAAGMAMVQQIRGASFGGASSAPSIGGGTAIPVTPVEGPPAAPAAAPAAIAPPPRIVNITLLNDGSPYTQEWIRNTLIPSLNEALGDGATINVT